MEGGDPEHDEQLERIADMVHFGKIKRFDQFPEGVLFDGRRWHQDRRTYDVNFNMNDYIQEHLTVVDIGRQKLTHL